MFYNLFTILPMTVALFWVILLLLDQQKNSAKRFLIFFLSLSVINYFVHGLYFGQEYELYKVFEPIWLFTSLVGYPLYYYYIRLLTCDTHIDIRWAWIVLPSFLLALLGAVISLTMPSDAMEYYIRHIMYHQETTLPEDMSWVHYKLWQLKLFQLIFPLQLVLSLFFSFRLIIRYNQSIKEFYSNLRGKTLNKVMWVLATFVISALISLLSNAVGKTFFIDYPPLIFLPSLAHAFYLFLIGYVGKHQNFTIQNFLTDKEETTKEKETKCPLHRIAADPPKNDSKTNRLHEELVRLFDEKKIFKDENLRITDVAAMLNTNRTYVSKIFNEQLNTNFCDYVNRERTAYAKELLCSETYDEYKMFEIAQEVGFSSESTFYRIFKSHYGVSPGQFKKQQYRYKK